MKKIMILGGGLLQSFVIKKAKELGYKTIVLDMNKNAVGFKDADIAEPINIINKDECLNIAKKNKIDGVITAATDYGVISAAYVAEKMGLSGISMEVAQNIKNKYCVRRILSEKKIDDTPQFFEISQIEDINKIKEEIQFPVMVKPCDGSGSKGVCKVNSKKELMEAIEEALKVSLSKKILIETFIQGKEYGVESFVYNDEVHILGIMKKDMTSPPYYAELGHSIPSNLSIEMEMKVKRIVKEALKALKVNFGAINIDLLITKDEKVCIVDMGARMGGNLIGSHIIPLSTGIDYMGNIIKTAVGDEPDFKSSYNKIVVTRLLTLTPGKVKKLPNFNKYKNKTDIDIICNLEEGKIINQYKNNLDGCGYIIVKGDNLEQSIKQAEAIKQKIDKEIIREKLVKE